MNCQSKVGMALLPLCSLLVCSACSGKSNGTTDASWDLPPLDAWIPPAGCVSEWRFSDITTQSPDLADNPYGGQPGWDHVDKYGPG